MFPALIKRHHFKDTRCFCIVFSLSFECHILRLLAGLVDDWQITFEKTELSVFDVRNATAFTGLLQPRRLLFSFLINHDRFFCVYAIVLFHLLLLLLFFFFFFFYLSLLCCLLRSFAASISHGLASK